MKIGIEGQRLFRRKKHGMDMVALELIRNLQKIDTTNEYFVFVKPDEDSSVLSETGNFQIVPVDGGFYPMWEQLALPKAAREKGCDILHCTSNTAPITGDIPLIVTLHDIIYMESGYLKILHGSGTPYQKFGNAYRRMVVPKVIRRSKKIITVSNFEKHRIGEFFGMDNDPRLTAVYNGVSEHFRPVTDPETLRKVKERYKLPDHYFFFLGNTDPKKNTKGVLRAFSDYLHQTGADTRLVMLDYDREELERLLHEIGDKPLIEKIILTGYVVNTDLPSIYSQSDLFLYPSLRESFGIPMLEAMACGVPVITSNTSSMPEVAGNAAFIINPFKPEEISSAMKKMTTDTSLRHTLISRGIERAKQFSWMRMAEEVLKLYYEITERKL